jgi:hypothetical protein
MRWLALAVAATLCLLSGPACRRTDPGAARQAAGGSPAAPASAAGATLDGDDDGDDEPPVPARQRRRRGRRPPRGRTRVTPVSAAALAAFEAGTVPEGTRSLRVKRSIVVRLQPRDDAKDMGTLAQDSLVRWKSSTRGQGPECPRWFAIEPVGYVCARYLEPSAKEPAALEMPKLAPEELVPGTYGKVIGKEASTYRTAADVRADRPARQLEGSVTVRKRREQDIDGKTYWETTSGELILGWARSHSGQGVRTRQGRHLSPRTLLSIKEISADGKTVVLSGGDSLSRADVHLAASATPPPHTGPKEHWLDVDLDDQVLVAYEGPRPVYATLVSTGAGKWQTPPGIYRIWIKFAESDMNGQMGDEAPYSVATVPWTMFYAKDFALHTAYWHDRFGEKRSHGCVNLSPIDARALYFWSDPDVPMGWSMANGIAERPGSMVRIRSQKVPDPPFEGYARKVDESRAAPIR